MRWIFIAFLAVFIQGCSQQWDQPDFTLSDLSDDFISYINPSRCEGVVLDDHTRSVSYYLSPEKIGQRYLRVYARLADLEKTICDAEHDKFTIAFETSVSAELGPRGRPIEKDISTHVLPITILVMDNSENIVTAEYIAPNLVFNPYEKDVAKSVKYVKTLTLKQRPDIEPYTIIVGFLQPPQKRSNMHKTPPISLIEEKPQWP